MPVVGQGMQPKLIVTLGNQGWIAVAGSVKQIESHKKMSESSPTPKRKPGPGSLLLLGLDKLGGIAFPQAFNFRWQKHIGFKNTLPNFDKSAL